MPKDNIRGILAHPNKRRIIKGAPAQQPRLGTDNFAEKNPRNKARII